MARETNKDRLRPWMPEKVINTSTPVAMMESPEDPLLTYPTKIMHRMIFVRNLSRRAISKCCSIDWQPTIK
jgi:hypothetical protein